MLRILHTSDWHLGHRLHDTPRVEEHAGFLRWLLQLLGDERIDVLLVCGDVFDMANPGSAVQQLYYDFLGDCARQYPTLDVVVIGGNHDSAGRLDAPASLAASLGITVVGGLRRLADGALDVDRMLVEVTDAEARPAGLVMAVPFIKRSDVREAKNEAEGIRAVYQQLTDAASKRLGDGTALIAMGHLYTQGGLLSEGSERRIQVGYLDAIDAAVFGAEVSYTALGHLHRGQNVGDREAVQYCGSPLPLAVAERGYRHQVRLVKLNGAELVATIPLPVPRFRDIVTIPERHRPVAEVLDALRALPRQAPEGDLRPEPLVEVRVRLDTVEPRLRARVEDALEGAWARLLRIDTRYTGHALGLPEQLDAGRELRSLAPREVFERRYARDYKLPVPDELLRRFEELLQEVQST